MSLSNIYNGAADNDGTGLPLRDAFTLVNSNFSATQGSIDALGAEDLAIRSDYAAADVVVRGAMAYTDGTLRAADASITSGYQSADTAIRGSMAYMDGTLRASISSSGDRVSKAGDTMSGTLRSPNVFLESQTAITSSGTLSVDFAGPGFLTVSPTADIFITGSNPQRGSTVSVRLIHDSTERTLTPDSRFTFIGTPPSTLTANVKSVLTVTAFGTNMTDVIGAFAASS